MLGHIAILMACHNRRETTLACLRGLFAQTDAGEMDVYLVDDGSTDGTGAAVRAAFPKVRVIQGSGRLYWAKGMELAWWTALAHERQERVSYAAFLWLNDDTMLFSDALAKLRTADDGRSVVVGSLADSSGRLVYGLGVAGIMNGNCVLVPRQVFGRVGVICGDYAHAWADCDYAMRVKRAGLPIVCAGIVGTAESHPLRPSLAGLSLRERWRLLFDPKGWNLHDLWLYRRRNWNIVFACLSCVHFVCHVTCRIRAHFLLPFEKKI